MATLIRKSLFTGVEHTMEFPLFTQETFEERLKRWAAGALIQDAFPELNDDEREFIMTGITPTEWDEEFRERD